MEKEIYSSKIFIGREKEIEIFEKFLDDPKREKNILNIYGKGGLGKTQLLLRYINLLEKRKQEGEDILFSPEPIDIYWTAHQRFIGILKTIATQLSKDIFRSFFFLVKDYNKLLEKDQVLPNSERHQEAEKKIFTEFVEDFKKLKAKKVVLFFDTAELSTDSVDHFWKDLLPMLESEKSRIFVVIAGREKVKFDLDGKIEEYALAGFEFDEVKKYFDEQKLILKDNILEKVNQISGGHPILIALTIDWITNGHSENELVNFKEEEDFKKNLIVQIQQLNFPEDQAILSMAYFLRRYDHEIFSYIWEFSNEKTKKIMENLSRFSFVKYRPPHEDYPGSCTLHDEMREMVNQYAWPLMDPNGEYRKKWNDRIIEYYSQKITQETDPFEQQNLNLERLFYLFDFNIYRGFNEARRLFKEARDKYDNEYMDAIIREVRQYEKKLPYELLHEMTLYRAVIQHRREKYREAVNIMNELLKNKNIAVPIKTEAITRLVILYTDAGQPQKAIALGQKLEKDLSNRLIQISSKDEDYIILKREIGELCNNIGFAYRNQNLLAETTQYYKKAISHYSETEAVQAPMARTRNNLGYVYHRIGQNREALAHSEIALKIRQKLNLPYEIGLSYNVMGIIYADLLRTKEAIKYFENALNAFERAKSQRGKALTYVAYGRLIRQMYWVGENFANEPPENHQDKYNQAADMLQRAVKIFRELPNLPNLIEASNEYGSVLRQQKDYLHSIEALQESLELSEKLNIISRKIDNLQDLGYVHFLNKDRKTALHYSELASKEALANKSYNLYGKAQMTLFRIKFAENKYDEAFEAGANACIFMLLPDPSGFMTLSPKEELIFDYFENEVTESLLLLKNYNEASRQCDFLVNKWKNFVLDEQTVSSKYESFIEKVNAIKQSYTLLALTED